MRILAAIIVFAAIGLAAAAAHADRPPSDSEKAAILQGFDAKADASCFMVQVSSVDSSWATITSAQPMPGETQDEFVSRCNPGDGVVVMHNPGAGWAIVTEGSDFGLCPIKGVPDAVALDFKLCRKPGRTMVARGNHLAYKPRTLGRYTRLHWSHWGDRVATATGSLDGTPIRLKASDLQACGVHPTYLRITAGTHRPVTSSCPV
jgi:hypothetical protein